MSLYDTLKLIHVLAAIVWLGGGILTLSHALRAATADTGHQLGLARDMVLLGNRVFGPASLLALLAGIGMVIESPAIGWGDTWIVVGLSGMVISGAIGGGALGKRVKALVARLEASGDGTAMLRRITRLAMVDSAVLLVVVWAMVARPGA